MNEEPWISINGKKEETYHIIRGKHDENKEIKQVLYKKRTKLVQHTLTKNDIIYAFDADFQQDTIAGYYQPSNKRTVSHIIWNI